FSLFGLRAAILFAVSGLFGAEIDQSAAGDDSYHPQDWWQGNAVVLLVADLNRSHVHVLFCRGVAEAAINQRYDAGHDQHNSEYLHASLRTAAFCPGSSLERRCRNRKS